MKAFIELMIGRPEKEQKEYLVTVLYQKLGEGTVVVQALAELQQIQQVATASIDDASALLNARLNELPF